MFWQSLISNSLDRYSEKMCHICWHFRIDFRCQRSQSSKKKNAAVMHKASVSHGKRKMKMLRRRESSCGIRSWLVMNTVHAREGTCPSR